MATAVRNRLASFLRALVDRSGVARRRFRGHIRGRIGAVHGGVLLALAGLVVGLATFGRGHHSPPQGLLAGDTVIVYGPRQLNGSSGSGQNYVEALGITPTGGQFYRLRLVNGAANGTARASEASVQLNGATIVASSEVNTGVALVEKEIVLREYGQDTIRVSVTGSGSYVTLSVLSISDDQVVLAAASGPCDCVVFPQTAGTQPGVEEPNPVTVVFTVPSDVAPPYRLWLRNHGLSGGGGASGHVTLNGVRVFTYGSADVGMVTTVTLLPDSNELILSEGGHGFYEFATVEVTATDTAAPRLTIQAPAPNTITNQGSITVSGTVSDRTAVAVKVNGIAAAIVNDTTYSATVPLSMEGSNLLTVVATDAGGRHTDSTRTVIRDTQSPALTLTGPADGTVTQAATIAVGGSVSDASSVAVNVNGAPLVVQPGGGFAGEAPLAEGVNVLTVTAADEAGNSQSVARTITRDNTPPTLTLSAPAEGATTAAATIAVSGTVTDATPTTVSINGTATAVGAGGAFTGSVELVEGENTVTVVATDAASNTSSISRTVTRTGEDLPPDPATVAPPLDSAVATSVFLATEFLYSGADPIQTGVAPGTITVARATLLRGRTLTRTGDPLPGVTVTVQDRPELGQTLTRADGMFDLVANGGGRLNLQYAKAGYLPVQRTLAVQWNQTVAAEDVVLVPVDPQVTPVDFSEPIEVARGSVVTDADGARQSTLLFEQGTRAAMRLPDGSVDSLASVSIRATEYTVGPLGRAAMPGTLPPQTAYTYAAELTADEALAAGATEVTFSKPVAFYLENFIGFPVGTRVPVGYYDRQQGHWRPLPDGRVVKVLGVTGGRAELDVSGSGAPADSAALDSLGVTDAERERLATLYAAGQELWRTEHTHFSPVDWNWPAGPPADAVGPQLDYPFRQNPACPNTVRMSIIECESQVLGEEIGITGTPFALAYRSSRVEGFVAPRERIIPLSGSSPLPGSIKRIDVEVQVGGRRYAQSFPAQPNQRHRFVWDGLDAYGRQLHGAQPFEARVGYVYDAVFQSAGSTPPTFGRPSGTPITSDVSRGEFTLWQEHRSTIGVMDAYRRSIGSWTLDVHHAYDPVGKVLHTGDGRQRGVDEISGTIRTIGGGTWGFGGDGGPATEAALEWPEDIIVGPEGSVYIADTRNDRVRRISPDGIITTVAGNGGIDSDGDGGPATDAGIPAPLALALGRDGSLYIAEWGNVIRKVDPSGIITTVAGRRDGDGYAWGDGGPATEASMYPYDIAVGPDNSLYILDLNCRIRQVTPDGIIQTIAGNDICDVTGDGGPASAASINTYWKGLAVGVDGSVYFNDDLTRIRRIGPDGVISTIGGTGDWGSYGDGGPATSAAFDCLTGLAVAADGSVLSSDQCSLRVRRIAPDGIVTTVAGNGLYGGSGDDGPAPAARFSNMMDIAVAPDGRILTSDDETSSIREIRPVLPGISASNILIASEDGREVYEFSGSGRHLRTLDALTGATLLTFAYNAFGTLTTITDADGDVTMIERDGQDRPTAIVGPYGHRTEVGLDARGYLASLTNPAGELVRLFHDAAGRLDSLVDPRGMPHRFEYDSVGRLARDADVLAGSQTLTRAETDSGYTVLRTTALGRQTGYLYEELSTGARRKVMTDPAGHAQVTLLGIDGGAETVGPDGTNVTLKRRGNPRWGMQSPQAELTTIRMPSGLTASARTASRAVLASSGNPLSLLSITDSVVFNNQVTVTTYEAAQRLFTMVTPEGRQAAIRIDSVGRVLSTRAGGLDSVSYTYDARGRIATARSGGQIWTYSYDGQGRLLSTLDPLGRRDSLFYDDADRLTRQVLPGGLVVQFAYDSSGNLTTITPPGRPAHTFGYTPVDLADAYMPPNVGLTTPATQYAYNLDRQLTRITRPDSGLVEFGYDAAGRPSTVTFDRGTLTYGYSPTTGQLNSIAAPGNQTLGFTYDGSLPKSVTWSGPVTGSVGVGYNADFRITSQTVNGDNSLSFAYDRDGLLTLAGGLGLKRQAATGLLERDSVGTVKTVWTYTTRGEPASYTATVGGTTLVQTGYTRDSLARITELVETIDGVTVTRSFSYDSAGRLWEVRQDGVLQATYEYDSNGNRLSVTAPGGMVTGSYDAQDRLLQYGPATYGYTSAGELKTKVVGTDTTFFTYDRLRNLTAVRLPDGTELAYVIDGQNRRVGKRVNGTLVQGFLYQNQLAPVAELDGANQVVSRFVYATRLNVPDYMVKGGVTYRLVLDHLGSVRLVVNAATGEVAQRLAYDEFGRALENSAPGFQPFGYAGGLLDSHTGLYRFGARDYDAHIGRWTAKDPIGFKGGYANLYEYVDNDPLNAIDPEGLQPIPLPPPSIPGGPWKWAPNVDNDRVGVWQDPTGKQVSWDAPDSHWDAVDGTTGATQRYDRWGNPITAQQAHSYRGPKQSPIDFARRMKGFGLRCVTLLGVVGMIFDAYYWSEQFEQCKKDPSSCGFRGSVPDA